MKTRSFLLVLALLFTGQLLASSSASAQIVVRVGARPALRPVYYAPRRVYAPRPVYYAPPRPVVLAPAPYYAPRPVYYAPRPVYYAPRHGYHGRRR